MAAKKLAAKHVPRIRFAPDPGTLAELHFELNDGTQTHVFGLVINESAGGCAIVLACDDRIVEGTSCLAKVGNLEITPASVRWVKKVDKDLIRLGIKYLL